MVYDRGNDLLVYGGNPAGIRVITWLIAGITGHDLFGEELTIGIANNDWYSY